MEIVRAWIEDRRGVLGKYVPCHYSQATRKILQAHHVSLSLNVCADHLVWPVASGAQVLLQSMVCHQR